MPKFTDLIRDAIIANFEAGDQPTAANFAEWILAIQEGIELHDHSGTGDGDGANNLVGPVGIGIAPTDTLHVLTATSWAGFLLENQEVNANASYMLTLKSRAGAVCVANDYIGGFQCDFMNSTPARVSGAGVAVQVLDPTAASEDTEMTFSVRGAGAWLAGALTIKNTGDVVMPLGNVGAGVVTPLGEFHVASAGSTEFLIEDTTQAIATIGRIWRNRTSGLSWYLDAMDDDLSAGLGVIAATAAGAVTIPDLGGGGNQDVGADNNGLLYVPFVSDKMFKTEVEPITGALEVVCALRGVTFNWNKEALADVGLDFGDTVRQAGLIAQEVVDVLPNARSDGEKYQSYRRSMIAPYLIEAIKELDARLTRGGL